MKVLKILCACLLALPLLACAGPAQITPAAQQGQSELSQGKAEIVNSQSNFKAATSYVSPIGQALMAQGFGALGRAAAHLDNGLAKFNEVVTEDGKRGVEIAIEHTWWFSWRVHQIGKWTLIIGGFIAFLVFAVCIFFIGIVNGLAGPVGGTAAAGWLVKVVRYVVTIGTVGIHDLGAWIGRLIQIERAAIKSVAAKQAAGPGTKEQPIATS